MKHFQKFLILAMILFSTPALADPSPGVSWLQKEPLTLFDWGIFKAQKELDHMAGFLLN